MSPDRINAAADEARRFLEKVDAAHAAFVWRPFTNRQGGFHVNENTRATAALRRASMDLTRVLADLRRPS